MKYALTQQNGMANFAKKYTFFNFCHAVPLRPGYVPTSPRSRSDPNAADAKLEKTSLSAGVL